MVPVITVPITTTFIVYSSWKPSFNLYCPDSVPHLQGQASQYLVLWTFVSLFLLYWGTCRLLCRWPVSAVTNVW